MAVQIKAELGKVHGNFAPAKDRLFEDRLFLE